MCTLSQQKILFSIVNCIFFFKRAKQKTLRKTAVGGVGHTLIVGTIWTVWNLALEKEQQIHSSGHLQLVSTVFFFGGRRQDGSCFAFYEIFSFPDVYPMPSGTRKSKVRSADSTPKSPQAFNQRYLTRDISTCLPLILFLGSGTAVLSFYELAHLASL